MANGKSVGEVYLHLGNRVAEAKYSLKELKLRLALASLNYARADYEVICKMYGEGGEVPTTSLSTLFDRRKSAKSLKDSLEADLVRLELKVNTLNIMYNAYTTI